MNFKNFTPITNGLFCEKIFGPKIDFQCTCKRYKKIQVKNKNFNKIIICNHCHVEITKSNIRNYRLG